MIRPLKFEDLEPSRLGTLVLDARTEMNWTIADLARRASVEYSSVKRVEDQSQETGVLTALNVAEAAKVYDFEQEGPDPQLCSFIRLLFEKEDRAAKIFKNALEQFGNRGASRTLQCDLLGIYNPKILTFRLQIAEPIYVTTMIRRDARILQNVFPRDLGIVGKQYLKLLPKKCVEKCEYTFFWNQLAAGRSYNVSSSRVVAAVFELGGLFRDMDERHLRGVSFEELKVLAAAAFRNHLVLDQLYKECLQTRGKKGDMPDFWLLISDLNKLLRNNYIREKMSFNEG